MRTTVLDSRKVVVLEKKDDEAFGFEIQVRRSRRPARCDGVPPPLIWTDAITRRLDGLKCEHLISLIS